ncbi:MAG: TIGR01777 family oxidoreductase [Bacteroidota bacterium]
MKIIVTGGTGFIGGAILARLREHRHHLVVLTRRPERSAGLLLEGLTIAPWDGKTAGAWAQHVESADAIINFAGEPLNARRWSAAQKERIIRSRVDAATALHLAVAQATVKPTLVINASAVGYYGDVPDGEVSEIAPPGKGFLAETCVRWEEAAQSILGSSGRVVTLRSGVVLARDGGALRRMLIPFLLFAGGPIGSGRQWFPWVHREDLIRVITFLLEHREVSGPLNVVAPESVTMETFASTLGVVLRRPSYLRVPAFGLKLLLGEMAEMLLTGQRVVPAKLRAIGFSFKFPSLVPALKNILR